MKNFSVVDLIPKDVTIEKSDLSHIMYRFIQQDKNYSGAQIHEIIQALNNVSEEEYRKKIDYELNKIVEKV